MKKQRRKINIEKKLENQRKSEVVQVVSVLSCPILTVKLN